MSQLIQPSGSLSKYVINGESCILDDDKQIEIVIFPKLIHSPERANDKVVKVGIWNSSKDIYAIRKRKIQLLNHGHVFSTRQLIVNRKVGLVCFHS